jgi:hypothetical protein
MQITQADFPSARIAALGDEFTMIDYPAFAYMHANNSEAKPIAADKGGRHLGQEVPGIAVPFPTRRYGMMHKHFGIGFYEGGDGGEAGEPFAYGKGVSLTAQETPKEFLAAAFIGDKIQLAGKTYTIEKRANDNIALIPA